MQIAITITDRQITLPPSLCELGVLPAADVGGKAQCAALEAFLPEVKTQPAAALKAAPPVAPASRRLRGPD